MTTTSSPAGRDPDTGELLNKISIVIYSKGQTLPGIGYLPDWNAARKFLASAEFKGMADTVEHLTITNRDVA